MTLLFSNNAQTTIAGSITNIATAVALAPGTGVEFPNPGAGQTFLGTLNDAATGLLYEIVSVTARATDTLTITRAQEGTAALAWNAGDIFGNFMTAGTAGAFIQPAQPWAYAIDTGAVNAYVVNPVTAAGGAAFTAYFDGMKVRWIAANANTGPSTINVNSIGLKNLALPGQAALGGGEIQLNGECEATYDGTQFQLTAFTPVFNQCYFSYVSATQVILSPLGGNKLTINNVSQTIPAAGVTGANTNVFVNGTAGQNLAVSTAYLVFAFMNAGVMTLDFRTGSTYALSATNGQTIRTGDATRTLVGGVLTNGSSQFSNIGSFFGVSSYWNRKNIEINLAVSGATTASGAMVEIVAARITMFLWNNTYIGQNILGFVNNPGGNQTNIQCLLDAGATGQTLSFTATAVTATAVVAGYGTTIGADGSHIASLQWQVTGNTSTMTFVNIVRFMG